MTYGRLSGKVAIVTGGGSGIGRAICQVFAREGASVAVLDINVEGMTKTLELLSTIDGSKHCTIESDVTCLVQVKQAIQTAEEQLGEKATVLVNCAGIAMGGLLKNLEEKSFDEVMKVNVKGTFLMSKEFVKSLEGVDPGNSENVGVIVNISSISGIRAHPGHMNYAASKFAVVGLTKTIAAEYASHKVRCNAVLPGVTKTPILQHLTKEFLDTVLEYTPMKRFAEPEEIGKVCLFLASDESSFVNGATLEVTGGWAL